MARRPAVQGLLQDNKFPFAFDIRNDLISPGEFLNPGFDIDALRADTKIAVEMQIHSRNFKRKGDDFSGPFGNSFRLVRVYKIERRPVSTPEKRRRGRGGADEWISHAAANIEDVKIVEYVGMGKLVSGGKGKLEIG